MPLHLACKACTAPCVSLLVAAHDAANAAPDATNAEGLSPLQLAVKSNHLETLQALLPSGGLQLDSDAAPLLRLARRSGALMCAIELTQRGACVAANSSNSATARELHINAAATAARNHQLQLIPPASWQIRP